MNAALVELAFMTNKEEAKLLMTDTYRRECAKELAQAMCEIYNVEFKEKQKFSLLDAILNFLKILFSKRGE